MRNLLQGNCKTHTNDIEPLLLRYAQECTGSRNEMCLAKFYEVKNSAQPCKGDITATMMV